MSFWQEWVQITGCPYCGKIYPDQTHLNQHIEKIHKDLLESMDTDDAVALMWSGTKQDSDTIVKFVCGSDDAATYLEIGEET